MNSEPAPGRQSAHSGGLLNGISATLSGLAIVLSGLTMLLRAQAAGQGVGLWMAVVVLGAFACAFGGYLLGLHKREA